MKHPAKVFPFIFLVLVSVTPGFPDSRMMPVPGTTLTLEFPDLPPMHDGLPAACEVNVPGNHDPSAPDRPLPLFVWFGGGKGSHKVDGARGLVDFDRWAVVALPYPGGVTPRSLARDMEIDGHWRYARRMLARVRELLPGVEHGQRVVAGTSSGAHMIGCGLDRVWLDFVNGFDAFILHEGGASPLDVYRGARDKRLLVVWGEKSTALDWQLSFNRKIRRSGAQIAFESVPGAGHGLTDAGREKIREWINGMTPSALGK
ncbi:hypothetical protein OpiT1DRAFT_02478 [Opitutaceae bacterium TAV1]|nr:hypothetical protein OPIT5_13905 [Opitutaceae bacterium TAV5]EIP98028.1 hypothetical protein OpiT1DRAFT_02478 [Opitutaceae bacterium TAV1]